VVCNTTGSGFLKQRGSHTHLSRDDTKRQETTRDDKRRHEVSRRDGQELVCPSRRQPESVSLCPCSRASHENSPAILLANPVRYDFNTSLMAATHNRRFQRSTRGGSYRNTSHATWTTPRETPRKQHPKQHGASKPRGVPTEPTLPSVREEACYTESSLWTAYGPNVVDSIQGQGTPTYMPMDRVGYEPSPPGIPTASKGRP